MKKFDQAVAVTYDQDIRVKVPGYELCHDLVECLLAESLGEKAQVLIVGAGTGKEITELAVRHPGWVFDAVDPSGEMIEIAKSVVEAQRLSDRVTFHEVKMEDFKSSVRFDAAVSVLVSHFLKMGEKEIFFKNIREHLGDKGKLILFDLFCDGDFREEHLRFSVKHGLQDQEAMRKGLETKFCPCEEDEMMSLLVRLRFNEPQTFLKVLGLKGIVA